MRAASTERHEVQHQLDPDLTLLEAVRRERDSHLRRSSVVEIVAADATDKHLGGLRHLVHWLEDREKVFSQLDTAELHGVEPTRGVLLVGVPGCGKSLAARVTASKFQVPLLRLDVGRLMGKYLGESEANLRAALATAEAAAPCILWIDELEKALASSDGESASGTGARMLGHLLTWMQDGPRGVFLFATANAVERLPPELLRRGRFDEMFFVDLPDETERLQIIEAQLRRRPKWSLSPEDQKWLARETNKYTGADLEALLKAAIEDAWLSSNDEPTQAAPGRLTRSTVETIRKDLVPLGLQWADKLEKTRAELKAKGFRPASLGEKEKEPGPRKTVRTTGLPEGLRPLMDPAQSLSLTSKVGEEPFIFEIASAPDGRREARLFARRDGQQEELRTFAIQVEHRRKRLRLHETKPYQRQFGAAPAWWNTTTTNLAVLDIEGALRLTHDSGERICEVITVAALAQPTPAKVARWVGPIPFKDLDPRGAPSLTWRDSQASREYRLAQNLGDGAAVLTRENGSGSERCSFKVAGTEWLDGVGGVEVLLEAQFAGFSVPRSITLLFVPGRAVDVLFGPAILEVVQHPNGPRANSVLAAHLAYSGSAR